MSQSLIFFLKPGFFLILLLLVPLVAWLVFSALRINRPQGLSTLLMPTLTAVIPLVGSLFLISSTEWTSNTEIAWTALESLHRLQIGGNTENSPVAWPNQSASPVLKAESAGPESIRLEISSGGGFILDEVSRRFLNGRIMNDIGSEKIGRYVISREKTFFGERYVIGFDGQKGAIANIVLPARVRGRNRSYSLSSLLDPSPADRPRDEAWFELQEWADNIRLLLTDAGEIRILSPDETASREVRLPAKLTLIQIGYRQRFRIDRTRNEFIRLEFLPPWRLASPVPPEYRSSGIIVSASAQPGDYAFILPFGKSTDNLRRHIRLDNDSAGRPVFFDHDATRLVPESGGDPRLPPGFGTAEAGSEEILLGATSQIQITAGDNCRFYLATLANLPRLDMLACLMLIALIPFFCGIWLTMDMSGAGRWCAHGLALCIWNLLIFRFMLAVRYAIDPRYLDVLAIKGLATSLAGLAVVPGFLLLMTRLRNDRNLIKQWSQRDRNIYMRHSMGFVALLTAVFFIESNSVSQIWYYLPEKLSYRTGPIAALTVLGISIFTLLMILVIFRSTSDKRLFALKAIFLGPVAGVEVAIKWFEGKWKQLLAGKKLKSRKGLAMTVWAVIFFIILPLVMAVISTQLNRIRPVDTFFHDLIVPLLFCWPVAAFWLASRQRITPGSKLPGRTFWLVFTCAVLTILLPAIILPVAIFDVGSLYSMLSVFLPLTVFLSATRIGLPAKATSLAFLLTFLLAGLLYLNFNALITVLPSDYTSTAVARMLVFKEGINVQRYIPFANAGRSARVSSFHANDIRNGIQHIWENNAIGTAGELTGLGYAQAPTRQSQIRHDTLTFDSVFSFFVLSEYGLIGATGLLLLFACPLAVVLWNGRSHFEIGHALAGLIASAFLLEALIHAGMNVSLLPFTGRNMPLLAVNSITDLLRWAILLTAASQSMIWKERDPKKNILRDTSFTQPVPTNVRGTETDEDSPDSRSGSPVARNLVSWGTVVTATCSLPVILAGAVLITANINRFVEENTSPFNWTVMLETVGALIEKQKLIYDQQAEKIMIRDEKIKNGLFLSQEIDRFNSLPAYAKADLNGVTELNEKLKGLQSLNDYDQLMNEFRSSAAEYRKRRPPLFSIVRREDGDGIRHLLTVNPGFNSEFSFSIGTKRDDFPTINFRNDDPNMRNEGGLSRRSGADDTLSGAIPLIGPAWVMGRWISVHRADAPLPWIGGLSRIINTRWRATNGLPARNSLGMLTLDGELQQAAMNFAREKGRSIHSQILKARDNDRQKLPPRVAVSVISLPDGETLALGGWPRMSNNNKWVKNGNEWLPPSQWIESGMPRPMRSLYRGDRNFDRMLVGSATKPLWASVVLSVHPRISPRFSTRGPAGTESEVFGIPTDKKWLVIHGNNNWMNLREYLRTSNNRFQVRLGFLGLALDSNGSIMADDGISPSDKESMNGEASWKRYPRFLPEIGFSKDNPGIMRSIEETPLARMWSNMYAVEPLSARHGDREMSNHRLSFWSADEASDLLKRDSKPDPFLPFANLSPEIPSFEFDLIDSPGSYVNLLLGGGGNTWANVELAAAFGTCLTGSPVIPHILKTDKIVPGKNRLNFVDIARKIRPGLRDVALDPNGTAYSSLRSNNALNAIGSLSGVDVYAKTGTLEVETANRGRSINRLVLALVKWGDPEKTMISKGLVISVVGEEIGNSTASEWTGEFISRNFSIIRKYF